MRGNPFAHGEMKSWDRRDPKAVCPLCRKKRTKAGHDPCIADLPGVMNACCGHGVRAGYIMFENGITVRMGVTCVEREDVDPVTTWRNRIQFVDTDPKTGLPRYDDPTSRDEDDVLI
jgi:hypothetical protein